MDKKKVCLYQQLNRMYAPRKIYACWPHRHKFNCPVCKRNKGNDNCPYAKEITPFGDYEVNGGAQLIEIGRKERKAKKEKIEDEVKKTNVA